MASNACGRHRDPELEQYEEQPERGLELADTTPSSKLRGRETEGQRQHGSEKDASEALNTKKAYLLNTLERALIDIRECVIKTMPPRKHPPKRSRAQVLVSYLITLIASLVCGF